MSAYESWRDGDGYAVAAFRELIGDLDEVRRVRERAEAAEKTLRAQLAEVVAALGGTATHGGYVARIAAPQTRASYDRAGLDALLAEIPEDIARRILALRKESTVDGGLRIEREKAK